MKLKLCQLQLHRCSRSELMIFLSTISKGHTRDSTWDSASDNNSDQNSTNLLKLYVVLRLHFVRTCAGLFSAYSIFCPPRLNFRSYFSHSFQTQNYYFALNYCVYISADQSNCSLHVCLSRLAASTERRWWDTGTQLRNFVALQCYRHAPTYPEFWFCHHQHLRPETPSSQPSYSETLQGPWGPWPQLSPWFSPSVCCSHLCRPHQTASAQWTCRWG